MKFEERLGGALKTGWDSSNASAGVADAVKHVSTGESKSQQVKQVSKVEGSIFLYNIF